jgi:hypothetical protein
VTYFTSNAGAAPFVRRFLPFVIDRSRRLAGMS